MVHLLRNMHGHGNTVFMAIVYPPEKITRQWNEAFDASRKRAPLVEFLLRQGLQVAAPGPGRNSDDIIRATLFIVDTALRQIVGNKEGLNPAQRLEVGEVTCCICDCLARLIEDHRCWRVAALVSTTKLTSPGLSLFAAANGAATAAEHFIYSNMGGECIETQKLAAQAIVSNDDSKLQELLAHVAIQIQQTASVLPWVAPNSHIELARRSLV